MSLSRIALGVLGGIALSASPAMAADLAAYIPPPADWTGAYFGGGVCYDWANFDVDQQGKKKKEMKHQPAPTVRNVPNRLGSNFNDFNQVNRNLNGPSGTIHQTHQSNPHPPPKPEYEDFENAFEGAASAPCATVTIGYDYQLDPLWVVGVFASYDWQNKRGDLFKVHRGELTGQAAGDVWLGNIATIAGRAGVLVTPKILVYGLVGFSWSNGGYSIHGSQYASALSGPTVGAGVEAILWKRLSGRLEYRYTNFGKMTNTGGSICEPFTNTASITDQSVRLVLTYKL